MKRTDYTEAIDQIVGDFGGIRRKHPNTWRIPVTASRGYFTLGTSSYRNRAAINLSRLYINPHLDTFLLNDLLTNPSKIGGTTGRYWSVYGISPSLALALVPQLLRSELAHIEQTKTINTHSKRGNQ